VAHEEYLPTGELWVDESDPTVKTGPKYLFTGKELDAATGLYYFGARSYDARLSQWNSPDPILQQYMGGGSNGGVYVPLNLGLYTYTFNNPVRLVDPTGRDPHDAWYVRFAKEAGGFAVGTVEGISPFGAAYSPHAPDPDIEWGPRVRSGARWRHHHRQRRICCGQGRSLHSGDRRRLRSCRRGGRSWRCGRGRRRHLQHVRGSEDRGRRREEERGFRIIVARAKTCGIGTN